MVLSILCFCQAHGKSIVSDTTRISALTGLKGSWNAKESIYRVASPRNDVPITVDGFVMPPFMGLTSWAAFTDGGKSEAMVMGDLVLFQDEVNPVLSVLLENGLQVIALHNHFFYEEPKVYFMHIGGDDSLSRLAGGVGKAFEKVREIRKAHPQLSTGFPGPKISGPSNITPTPIEELLGTEGEKKDGMLKLTFGRKTQMPCGCEAGKGMGVNTWAAFAGTDANALVDGDFAMREEELQGVLKSLRKSDINIVAIHQHMIEEKPRIIFLHYWGKGKALGLARGVKAALDTQKKD
ncbi:MAG: hypothetical protein JWO30_156 [Fibrobacteres bacterium]|nr:hypothetical protein [Fibrobacterota bacterium]